MGLFDQYSGVRKHGYQVYKKNHILVEKELCDSVWEQIKMYFSTNKELDYNLAYYLGDNGITASYSDYYCSKEDFKKRIEPVLKREAYY